MKHLLLQFSRTEDLLLRAARDHDTKRRFSNGPAPVRNQPLRAFQHLGFIDWTGSSSNLFTVKSLYHRISKFIRLGERSRVETPTPTLDLSNELFLTRFSRYSFLNEGQDPRALARLTKFFVGW